MHNVHDDDDDDYNDGDKDNEDNWTGILYRKITWHSSLHSCGPNSSVICHLCKSR